MTDFGGLAGLKDLVMNFKQQVIDFKFKPNGENCVDKDTFYKDNPLADKSIFSKLDLNKDGYITEFEFNRITMMDSNNDGKISEKEAQENKQNCMHEAMFFARRNIDKWFTVDVDRDGKWSNVEAKMAEYRMNERYEGKEHIMDSSLSNEELSKKYLMAEKPTDMSIEKWIDGWLEYIKTDVAQNMYGIELTSSDMAVLRAECMKQLNTWLFKTGDNKTGNAPLYNSLNVTAYTRLLTTESAVSCCGGDITPPPMTERKDACGFVFRPLSYNQEEWAKALKEGKELDESKLTNNANEVKNRLAWAAFPTPSKDKLSDSSTAGTVWMNFSDEEYAKLNQQWEKLRNTSAKELREMLKPINYFKRKAFEENTIMSVAQMVQYIDIVESVTGKSWDDSDWEITGAQFYEIGRLVNDTAGDETRLDGKTREDIPDNRQKLRDFLEEKGWLYNQFSENGQISEEPVIQQFWEKNKKNELIFNNELHKASRKILSKIEQEKIKKAKEKELQELYNPNEYEYLVETNKYGDLHWVIRKKENV